jgi:hypothetical protein
MPRELIDTVPASELDQWTGYQVDYAGQVMTVHAVRPGPHSTTVTATLAYPADMMTKPIEVELLRASDVDIYRGYA